MMIDIAVMNRLNMLQAIRRNGPIARVELVEILGLTKGTVSAVSSELIKSGMVMEGGSTGGETGRPRVLLEIQSDSFAVVGASLNFQGCLELSLVDLSGKLIESENGPLMDFTSLDKLVDSIAHAISDFIDRSSVERSRIASGAVAVPGIVETSRGIVHWFPTLAGTDFPAAKVIGEHLGIPIVIENDVDCLARAQHWFGEGYATADFTIVYIGLAVGLAQYVAGLPRSGMGGTNSEFGHVKTDFGKGARQCFCGASGCLTAYSSFLGLVAPPGSRRLRMPDVEHLGHSVVCRLEAAHAGDLEAIAALRLAGKHLGLALSNYVNLLDPGHVIIMTADDRIPELIKGELETTLAANTLPTLLGRTKVEVKAVLPDWRWKGTAALALERAYLGAPHQRTGQVGKSDRT